MIERVNKILKMNLDDINSSLFDRFNSILGITIVLLGISQSLFMNLANRSLWLDEAMLASSLSQRHLFSLTCTPLDYNQIAPPVYIYLCKIITIIAGNTEFTLRMLSFVSYIAVVLLVYIIADKMLKIKYPIYSSALIANIGFMLRYSNEFKQYMFESMIVLLILFIYYLYNKKKINWKFLFIICPLSVWCANPVCFFLGGIISLEIIASIKNKDKKLFIQTIYICSSVGVGFILYYFYWLQSTSNTEWLTQWWAAYFFPLFPKNINEIDKIIFILSKLFFDYSEQFNFFIFSIIILSLFKGVYNKNRYIIIILISLLLCLLASYIKKCPLNSRVCLFLLPIMTLVIFYGISIYINQIKNTPIILIKVLTAIAMITLNIHFIKINTYFNVDSIYRKHNEPNLQINYIKDCIKNDEKVFVFHWAIPTLKYKIGYNIQKIGDTLKDNIIWSKGTFTTDFFYSYNISEDTKEILLCNKCYILNTLKFENDRYFGSLLNELDSNGFVELIFTKYDNPIYFFAKKAKDLKQRVKYEIINIINSKSKCSVILRLTNTGDAYIGGTKYENIYLSAKNNKFIEFPLDKHIAPQEYTDILVEFNWGTFDENIELQLKNKGKYWFDEFGCEPIRIKKPN